MSTNQLAYSTLWNQPASQPTGI